MFKIEAGAREGHEAYKVLAEKLVRRFKGVTVRKGSHGVIRVSCGGRVSHRLVFIPPAFPLPRGEKKVKGTVPPIGPSVAPIKPRKGKTVKVALVIDDIGNDRAIAKKLLDLPIPITLSIFPFAPYSREIAKEALAKRHVILMHLPMEPIGYPGKGKDPGPGALYVRMSPEEIKKQLNADLDRIPEVSGINNHMGSRFTCDSEGMRAVMVVLKQRKKIFLDSRTIAGSVGYETAKEVGIPTARRDVFLDNTRDVATIRRQLDHLVAIAKKRGTAIGIGHPHRATYLALKKAIPEYLKEGVEFVYITSLVH